MQEIALFSGKIYTAGTYFTRLLVMTVATNLNSAHSIYSKQAALLEFGDLGKLLCGAVLVSSRYVSKLEETFLRT